MVSRTKAQLKFERFASILKGSKNLLVVMQDNPDPDAIATAVALRKLANNIANIPCSISHGGTIGRGENRALVRYLALNLHHCDQIDFSKFDLIAMVDTQPHTGNNSLPADVVPDIIFDHHPFRRASREVQFTDIRSKYGATSTILFEYLTDANIEIDVPLATALLYAIRSDTQDLGREATRSDIEAIGLLYPLANKRMLGEIQRGEVQKEYFQMLAEALKNAKVYQGCIITALGQAENPDMIAEVADLLLREEQTYWTMCYGFANGKLLISIRTCLMDKGLTK